MKMAKDKKKHIDAEINKTLLDDFDKFDGLVHTRWKEMLYGCVGIIIVVAIAYSIYQKVESNKALALDVLTSANTESELIEAINKYGNSPATDSARLRLANIFVANEQYDKAIAEMNNIIQNNKNAEFKSRVTLDVAYIVEKSGDLENASAKYLQVANNDKFTNAIRVEAFYSASRLAAKAGDVDSAKNYLNNLEHLSKNGVSQDNVWVILAQTLAASID